MSKPGNIKLEVEISSIAYGGKGVARANDGKVVFVPETLPGEIVLVELTKEHGDYFDGLALEIARSSPKRVDPDCMVSSGFDNTGKEYFVPVPGCVYRNFAYDEEVRVKNAQFTEFVQRALRRLDPAEPRPRRGPQGGQGPIPVFPRVKQPHRGTGIGTCRPRFSPPLGNLLLFSAA